MLSGVLRWMIPVFCRMCNEQLAYKRLPLTMSGRWKLKWQWNRFFSKCFGFLSLVNISPVHASIIRGLTSRLMRRHIRRDVFWTHDDDDDDDDSNSRQQLGSLPVSLVAAFIWASVLTNELLSLVTQTFRFVLTLNICPHTLSRRTCWSGEQ